ncbi:MAG: hypothetical protein ACR2RA_01795 [Geminicoccaceae bacterium]
MSRRHLFRLLGVVLLGFAVFGLSHHRGSANVEAKDRKLEAFVEAALAVDGVMAAWRPKIVRAEGQTVEALRQEANLEIRQSIERVHGISFAEYKELRQAIALDPHMRRRVTELMQR